MDIRTNSNAELLGQEARTVLAKFLKNNARRSILLLCSGGSALDLLQDTPKDCLGPNMTLGVLDERYSSDEAINNFAQLEKTSFFQAARRAGAHVIDTRPKEGETHEQLTLRFESELRSWMKDHPGGIIVATMGIGSDGHTAGIMPFPEDETLFWALFGELGRFVQDYDAGDKNQHPQRITITLSFLVMINHAIVYCVGEGKRIALERVMAEEGSCAHTPARIIREMKDVLLFTDITL
ncbi:6-phosphogluconolactonase [Candidatus Uhrbacteria bacterium]|nr:6-phosphogluconolactonase [Candidatus Uhrbacteria bacterium]